MARIYPDAHLDFGGAKFRLIRPDMNLNEPDPEAGEDGEWDHIPGGGNIFISDGSPLHTTWTPEGGIEVIEGISTLRGLRKQFATLTVPTDWTTNPKFARLASLKVSKTNRGTWRGSCTFEWSE